MAQFSLPLLSTVVLTMAIRERKKKKKSREEGSDEAGVCALPPPLSLSPPPPHPPGLTIASHFSLLPANPYYLQCKQKAILSAHLSCAWHCRCGGERGPPNSCAQQKAASCVDPWPVVQSHQPALWVFIFIFLFFARRPPRG